MKKPQSYSLLQISRKMMAYENFYLASTDIVGKELIDTLQA
jgi:hypothetical protein